MDQDLWESSWSSIRMMIDSQATNNRSSRNDTNSNKSKQQQSYSTTNVVVDRYKHDMEQAEMMRQTLRSQKQQPLKESNVSTRSLRSTATTKQQQSQSKKLSEEDVQVGLRALDQADDMREQGDLERSFQVCQLALELLIQFLNSDPSVAPSICRETVASRVHVAMSDAEATKRRLKEKQQSDQRDNNNNTKTKQTSSSSLSTSTKTTAFQGTYAALSSILDSTSWRSNKGSKQVTSQSSNATTTSKAQQISSGRQPATTTPKSASTVKKTTRPISKQNSNTAIGDKSKNTASNSYTSKQVSRFLNSNDPLVETIKNDLYVDQSQLQQTSWDDIAGLDAAKQALQEAAVFPLMRPDLFTGLRKPRNILLYGPPGTGKTMLVRAVAKESNSLLFICSASSLTSKWHGEGEKLVRTLFEIARASAPSIIFVDEMDALLSSRKSDGEHEASRRFKTEFMTQMDGIVPNNDGTSKHMLLISCTNCPWDVDSAVMRRFPRRIYIPLPDATTRKALLKKLLATAGKHKLTASQEAKLVNRTAGFSGSDIASIASEAAFGPLRSLGSMDAIKGAKENDIRPISFRDFEDAINQATKSVPPVLLQQYEKWKEEQSAS